MALRDVFSTVDAVYISNPRFHETISDLNFVYFTRLLSSNLSEGASIVLTRTKKCIITIPQGESEGKSIGFSTYIARSDDEKISALRKILKGKKVVGLSFPTLTVKEFNDLKSEFKGVKFVDVSPLLDEMRSIKDDQEISLIREAIKISGESMEETLAHLKTGVTEKEIASILSAYFLKNGADGNAFYPIIAFGENTFEGHHYPGKRKLKKGDFVLMDYGARYMRYNADITRTFVYGKGSEKQKLIYETVKQEQDIGIKALKDGVTGKEIHSAMKELIDRTEFKRHCSKGTSACNPAGHGIGLGVHDHPGIGADDWVFRKNMVTTVEPGIYVPGLGGVRIEDDVLVKKNGNEILSKNIDKSYREL